MYLQPFMRQQSADLQIFTCCLLKTATSRMPVESQRTTRSYFRETLPTPSCNRGRLRQNPTRPLKQLAAVATPPLRANSTGYRDCLSHRCIAAEARAIHRSQERPPRLKSGGTQVQLAARRRGRAHNLELARAPCGCKAAQQRVSQDAQGPEQTTTKASPKASVGPTGSGL